MLMSSNCQWLEREFIWTDRTAQRYMAAAEHFDGKTDIMSDLPATSVYELAAKSTPEETRQEIVDLLDSGNSSKIGRSKFSRVCLVRQLPVFYPEVVR